MPVETVEAPPAESQLTPTGREIMDIERRSQQTAAESSLESIEKAFERDFPDGIPQDGTPPKKADGQPLPTATNREPLKAPMPEALFKPPGKDAPKKEEALTPDAEKAWVEDQTKDMKPDASSRFKSIHARAVKAEQVAKAHEAKMKELETRTAKSDDTSDVERLTRERDELDEIVKVTKLERHPKFRDAFDGEINRQVKAAKAIAGEKLGKEVAAVMESGDDEKWTEISEKLGPMKSAQIAAISANVQKLKIDKAEQLENWKENYSKVEELESKQKAQFEKQHKAAMEKAVTNVLAAVQHPEKGLKIFQKVEGNEDWNGEVDSRLERVREIASSELSHEARAALAMQAVAADKYKALFDHFLHANALLVEALQKYRSGEPGFAGTDTGRDPGLREKMGFFDKMELELKELGALK